MLVKLRDGHCRVFRWWDALLQHERPVAAAICPVLHPSG